MRRIEGVTRPGDVRARAGFEHRTSWTFGGQDWQTRGPDEVIPAAWGERLTDRTPPRGNLPAPGA